MTQPRRLAITISGAVSLGSYEAGVLYEIFTALDRNNRNARQESEKIVIDVLAGASAGGMTAAIAAQVLLDPSDRFTGPYDNTFYNPWVRDSKISAFLQASKEDDEFKASILASSQVQLIAEKYLKNTIEPTATPHSAAAPSISLGLAMSNLQGVDYARQTLGANKAQESFIYTRFQDEFLRNVRKDGDPVAGTDWAQVREAALACGAFPFAFRPRDIERAFSDYSDEKHDGLDLSQFPNGTGKTFTYVDGGVFHNEPLGLARDLVTNLYKERPDDTDTRFYLFVSPDAKVSQRPETKADPKIKGQNAPRITAKTETMPSLAKHLMTSLFTQARFQDWITASKVNNRVHQLDLIARAIGDRLLPGPDGPADPELALALERVADALLPILYETPGPGEKATTLGKDLERIAVAYADFGPETGGGDYKALLSQSDHDLWLRSVLLFEKTAQLEKKEVMTIFTITASTNELAGDPFASFTGFLSAAARKHDYDVGRFKAQDWLRTNAKVGGCFPLNAAALAFPDELFGLPVPSLGGLSLSETPEPDRRKLRDRIVNRVRAALGIVGWLAWLPLRSFINKKLELFRS